MRFKRTSIMVKLLILAICIYSIVTLISLQPQNESAEREYRHLAAEVQAKNQQKLQLEEDIAALDTPDGTRKIARERLGYVEDGEIVFYDSDN